MNKRLVVVGVLSILCSYPFLNYPVLSEQTKTTLRAAAKKATTADEVQAIITQAKSTRGYIPTRDAGFITELEGIKATKGAAPSTPSAPVITNITSDPDYQKLISYEGNLNTLDTLSADDLNELEQAYKRLDANIRANKFGVVAAEKTRVLGIETAVLKALKKLADKKPATDLAQLETENKTFSDELTNYVAKIKKLDAKDQEKLLKPLRDAVK